MKKEQFTTHKLATEWAESQGGCLPFPSELISLSENNRLGCGRYWVNDSFGKYKVLYIGYDGYFASREDSIAEAPLEDYYALCLNFKGEIKMKKETCKFVESLSVEQIQELENLLSEKKQQLQWVKDSKTGLEWGPIATKTMTWQEAMDWARLQGGRLPTRVELIDLFDNGPQEIKKACQGRWLWSSSSYANNTSSTCYAVFYNGFVYGGNKDDSYSVRCVRP